MDDTNKSILQLLRENGRMPFATIGSKLGISRVAVKKRVEKMESKGVITGYRAVTREEERVKMFLSLSADEDAEEEVIFFLNRSGYAAEIYLLNGDGRIMAVVEAPELSELKYLVKMLEKTFKGRIKTGMGNVVREVVRNDFGGVRYDETRYRRGAEGNKGDEPLSGRNPD